jgi:hypothetical protein
LAAKKQALKEKIDQMLNKSRFTLMTKRERDRPMHPNVLLRRYQKWHKTVAVGQHTTQQISGNGVEIHKANQSVLVEIKWTKSGKAESKGISRATNGTENVSEHAYHRQIGEKLQTFDFLHMHRADFEGNESNGAAGRKIGETLFFRKYIRKFSGKDS